MTAGVNSRNIGMWIVLIAIELVSFLFSADVHAATTRWVNNNAPTYIQPGRNCEVAGYTTIQSAVDAASEGDTVSVCPGTYTENINISTNNLKVLSVGGAAVTIVNAAESFYVFWVNRSTNVTIDGFTIVPVGSADGDLGINVAVEGDANTKIINNDFNGGRIGVNLGCASANSNVAHNRLNGQSEAAINIDTCEGSESGSDGNSVHHNSACGGVFSYSIAAGEKSDNNLIHHNVAIWITVSGTGNNVHHNIAEYFNIAAGNTNNQNFIDLDACP